MPCRMRIVLGIAVSVGLSASASAQTGDKPAAPTPAATPCFTISQPVHEGGEHYPILLDTCTGMTWLLIRDPIVNQKGQDSGNFSYRWYQISVMALIIPPDVLRQLAAIPRRDGERLLEALEMVAAEPATRFSFVTEMVGHRVYGVCGKATGGPSSAGGKPMWWWTASAIEGMCIDEPDQTAGRDAGNRHPDAG
jgi:hypothetical protein